MYYWIIYNNSTGAIGTGSSTHLPDPSFASSGFGFIGPYDDADNPMSTDFKVAYDNPQAYLYQNGAFTDNPNWSTMQLSQAQQAQISQIKADRDATLAGGFTSKLTGHTYITTIGGQANMEGDLKRFELDPTLTSVQFYTADKDWLAHSHQDLINAFLDGGKWKDAQYVQAQSLINQINTLANASGTTVAQIQAVVWTPATY